MAKRTISKADPAIVSESADKASEEQNNGTGPDVDNGEGTTDRPEGVTIEDATEGSDEMPEGVDGGTDPDELGIETDPNNVFWAKATVYASPIAGKPAEGKEGFTFFVVRTARDAFHAEGDDGETLGLEAPDARRAAGAGIKVLTDGDTPNNWNVAGLDAFDKAPLPEGNAPKEINPALEDEKFSAEMRELADKVAAEDAKISQAENSGAAAWLNIGTNLGTAFDNLRNHSMNAGKPVQAIVRQWGAWLAAMTAPGGAFYRVPRLAKTAGGDKNNVVNEAIAYAKAPDWLRDESEAKSPKTFQKWTGDHTRLLSNLVAAHIAKHRDATDGKGTPMPLKKLGSLTGAEVLDSLNFVLNGGPDDYKRASKSIADRPLKAGSEVLREAPEGLVNKVLLREHEAEAAAEQFTASPSNTKGIEVTMADKLRELPKGDYDQYRANRAMVAVYNWLAPGLPTIKPEMSDEEVTKAVLDTPKLGAAISKAWEKLQNARAAAIAEREAAARAKATAPAPAATDDGDVIETSRTDESGAKVPFEAWEVAEKFAHLAKLWGGNVETMAEDLAEVLAFAERHEEDKGAKAEDEGKASEDNATA